jgi:hypothetical protein
MKGKKSKHPSYQCDLITKDPEYIDFKNGDAINLTTH